MPSAYVLALSALAFAGRANSDVNFVAQPLERPYFVRENDQNVVLPCAFGAALQPSTATHWIRFVNDSARVLTNGRNNYEPASYDLDVDSCVGCYNLRIKSVKFEAHNGKFYCQVAGRDSTPAHVVVLVRPGFPSFANQPSFYNEGNIGRLDCESAGGNPAPRISWFFSNGTDVTRLSSQINATDPSKPTVSQLQWPLNANDHLATLSCKVWNEAMDSKEPPMEAKTSPLNVIYAPRVTVGPASPYSVIIGDTVTLQCTARSNPPVIRYSWRFNNNLLDPKTPTLAIPAVGKSNAGNYSCWAENGEKIGIGTTLLNILYPPEITLPSEYRSAVGRKVTMTCAVDANPSPSSVTWTAPDGRTVDGATLDIESVSLRDGGNYSCTAKNFLSPSKARNPDLSSLNAVSDGAGQRVSSKSVALIIDHAPGPSTVQLAQTEPAKVGSTINLTCSASDPGSPAGRYRWRRPSDSEFAEYSSQHALTLYDLRLTDAGKYSCAAYNVIGQGEAGSIDLIVYEPAHIDKHMNLEETRNENDTGFKLNCTVRGNPAPKVLWFHDNETISDDSHWQVTSSNLNECRLGENCMYQVQSFLKWNDAIMWSDKGEISCGASNGAGPMVYSKTLFTVFHKPVIINDPSRPFVASDIGRSVDVVCKASSKPDPTFAWSRNRQPLPSTFDYTITSRRNTSSTDLFESTLTIRNLREQDMGDFECVATNRFGSGAFIFTIQPRSKPWSPTEFHSPIQTHRSILISWKPGFNGGSEQTFSIEINYPDGSPHTLTIPETAPNLKRTKRQAGLETTPPLFLNITSDVVPSAEYKFRIKAKNDLGETEWSPHIVVWSNDAPLNLGIAKITQASLHTESSALEFQPTNLDSHLYCILVYLRARTPGSHYYYYDCADPSQKMTQMPDSASSLDLKLRFCYRNSFECGPPYELASNELSGASVSWSVLVGVLSGTLVLAALLTVCFVLCRRWGRFRGGEKSKSNEKTATVAINKFDHYAKRNDFDSNSNSMRPKIISGPYLTEKTPGPSSNGVYSTSGPFGVSYNYDADQDTRHYFDNTSQRRSNADAPPAQWADAAGGVNNTFNHRAFVDVFDGYDPAALAVPVAGSGAGTLLDGVDMRLDPTSAPAAKFGGGGGTRDSGLSSAYSTPTQRRIIREIIV